MVPVGSPDDDSTDPMGDEQCAYQPGDTVPVSRFDNYQWRGPHLAHLPFFEYCMLVQSKNARDAIATDLEFDPRHPKHGIQVQRLARKKSQVVTVTFNGQLSQSQSEEESVPGGHPVTTAMKNDLAESKEDSQIDAALRRAMDGSQNSFTRDLDVEAPADLDLFDDEEALDTLQEDFSTETLIAAYHSVATSW
ncbi:hypothetical protein OIDMADRAFT_55958 [Oidiodendron maius Zn]|uniref:Uncharacterized protein n=1 Tax=Oidiodendron maius (strain Zn) TaxID=913774 RepID=A0A0C3DDN1_OIDMZ|nr:hypothetical protein OIDMADRAFT_55958 [Oidiodendron maius Zn]